MGYTTGWFAAGSVGNVVGLILLGALLVAVFVAAAVTVGSAIAHIVSRLC